jgi:DNA-binding transcriptional ArsR family regulator
MQETHTTPGIAALGALIGDRARAEMLLALMHGEAQTATELSAAAAVTKQTASSHLTKLVGAGLLDVVTQGRHRYFRIADRQVARLIESLVGVAERGGATREFGPRDLAMRKARVCYDHLAGELGVLVHDSLQQRRMLRAGSNGLELTDAGVELFDTLGVDADALAGERRPLCRPCLDWSLRRYHLAGAVGAALLHRCVELRWAKRLPRSRVMSFSAAGERAFRRVFIVTS